MRSLRIINIIIKVLRIVCIVLFALNIAAIVGCAIGMAILPAIRGVVIPDGRTLEQFLLAKNISYNKFFVYGAIGILSCGASAFMCMYIAQYLKTAQDQQTPFTRPLVKQLRKVALVDVIVQLGVAILSAIAFVIARAIDQSIGDFNLNYGVSFAFAISLLILSLFVEYPVELEEQSQRNREEQINPEDYQE